MSLFSSRRFRAGLDHFYGLLRAEARMSIAPNATEERPQALGRVFRHEFARALAYLRLGAIPAYIVAYFGIRRVFRVTAQNSTFMYVYQYYQLYM